MNRIFPGTTRFPFFAALLVYASLGSVQNNQATFGQNVEPGDATADLVILNARLWPVPRRPPGELPPAAAQAQKTALAVKNGRIVAVGFDDEIRRHIGSSTRVIEARGKRVIPGLTDSHTHIISGGLGLTRLNLRQAANREEFVRLVGEAAKQIGPGQWVQGGRWSVESWADARSPDKTWLDPVTGNIPVFLSRMDGHQSLVNSAALKMAGIDAKGPPDPLGGQIERDPKTNEPTGILKESAMDLLETKIPATSAEERYAALRRAMAHANSFGVTSVHDMSDSADLEIFRRAHEEGALTLRISSYLSVSDWRQQTPTVKSYPIRDDLHSVPGFKGYMDGSLGSRTAYMREPYTDASPDALYPRGQLNAMADPPEEFARRIAEADAVGLHLAVHAIGDEANHLLLDAYESAAARNGARERRHRIEHVQHLRVEDIPRFHSLGVVASMQPFHKSDDGRYAEKAIGKERLKGSYAFRQLWDAGALLCFGSDFPVVTLNPFAGIDVAVNARTLSGDVWLSDHSLSLDEALQAYAVNPPKAIGKEDRLGRLEVGYLADIVILAADPFTMPKERLAEVSVEQTIFSGKTVYVLGE